MYAGDANYPVSGTFRYTYTDCYKFNSYTVNTTTTYLEFEWVNGNSVFEFPLSYFLIRNEACVSYISLNL